MKLIIVTALAITPLLAMDRESAKRLDDSAAVFSEVMSTPDKSIPQDLFDKASGIEGFCY
jgi:SH3 domain-containing YSC84-like protein 1